MALTFELKKKCNFFFMMVVVRMMRPTILVLAAKHADMSMADTFYTLMLITWVTVPLHSMPI
jgi:hypothetical protein